MSEAASVSENKLYVRILTDLASAVSHIIISEKEIKQIGFKSTTQKVQQFLNYDVLHYIYTETPGLEADKLKEVLKLTWNMCKSHVNGIVLAYDEAQNLKDKSEDKEFPLSLRLEITQYVQRMQMPYLLILTGLPTLFGNLVEARTYAERMFHQMILRRLTPFESREAIIKPIQADDCPVRLSDTAIEQIIYHSGGYPYFIQYLCKEIYDSVLQQIAMGNSEPSISFQDIIRKLDSDFYQGRWNRATDKQRNLLNVIASLENAEQEFSLKDIEAAMKAAGTSVSTSAINTMLKSLNEAGLIYKTRHGIYSFAVPMFSHFIKRENN